MTCNNENIYPAKPNPVAPRKEIIFSCVRNKLNQASQLELCRELHKGQEMLKK